MSLIKCVNEFHDFFFFSNLDIFSGKLKIENSWIVAKLNFSMNLKSAKRLFLSKLVWLGGKIWSWEYPKRRRER